MLILSRRLDEQIWLFTKDGPICVGIADIDGGKVRLSFTAPDSVKIFREEILSDAQWESVKGLVRQ